MDISKDYRTKKTSQRYYTRTNFEGNFVPDNWEYLGHPNDFVYDHDKTCPLQRTAGNNGSSGIQFNAITVFSLLLGAKYMWHWSCLDQFNLGHMATTFRFTTLGKRAFFLANGWPKFFGGEKIRSIH